MKVDESFGPIWAQLTPLERKICANAMIEHYCKTADAWANWHKGLLPFARTEDVMSALTCLICPSGGRVMAKLVAKCRTLIGPDPDGGPIMNLDDGLVTKHFGSRPWVGKVIKGATTKVTVGVRWSLPRRKHEPDDDVLVNATVALVKQPDGWLVQVAPQWREFAINWLTANCVMQRPKKTVKRVRQHRKRANRGGMIPR